MKAKSIQIFAFKPTLPKTLFQRVGSSSLRPSFDRHDLRSDEEDFPSGKRGGMSYEEDTQVCFPLTDWKL